MTISSQSLAEVGGLSDEEARSCLASKAQSKRKTRPVLGTPADQDSQRTLCAARGWHKTCLGTTYTLSENRRDPISSLRVADGLHSR